MSRGQHSSTIRSSVIGTGAAGTLWIAVVVAGLALFHPSVDAAQAAPFLVMLSALAALYYTALYLESREPHWALIGLRAFCTGGARVLQPA